jgi:hypothetical protein
LPNTNNKSKGTTHFFMENLTKTPTMRQVLGDGWFKPLAQRSGVKDSGTLSRLVNLEYSTSKHWRAVLDYAREMNPGGYAAWAAANPDKVLPVAIDQAA